MYISLNDLNNVLLGACVFKPYTTYNCYFTFLLYRILDSEVIWYMLRTENESRPTINLKHLKLPPEHHYTSLFPFYNLNALSLSLSLSLSVSLSFSWHIFTVWLLILWGCSPLGRLPPTAVSSQFIYYVLYANTNYISRGNFYQLYK